MNGRRLQCFRIFQIIGLSLGLALFVSNAFAAGKAVYHIDDAKAQATKALRNIRNHLDTAPDAKIVVVTHANGVDFLLEDATDKNNPNIDYSALISALKTRGVAFEVCKITLKKRNLTEDQFNLDAEFTPSGVVRITQLQNQDGYAYIKP